MVYYFEIVHSYGKRWFVVVLLKQQKEEWEDLVERCYIDHDRMLRALARSAPRMGKIVDKQRPLFDGFRYSENVYALCELLKILQTGYYSNNIAEFFNGSDPCSAAVKGLLRRNRIVTFSQFFKAPLEDLKEDFLQEKVQFPAILEVIHEEFHKLG